MQFRCKNCGGNVVYDPASREMVCLSCNSHDTEEIVEQQDSYTCVSCGGKYNVNEFTSATKCPFCGVYAIVDEKVKYPYGPDKLIAFKYTKDGAAELLKEQFKTRMFCPSDFLSKRTLENLTGEYVPFWLYSYKTHAVFSGIGTKVRSWTSGNYQYTETSKYDVYRELNIEYSDIPVDASVPMPDNIMDLMEPYDYREFRPFDAKYMSGFNAETYNMPPNELESRAINKVNSDTQGWLNEQLTGYTTLTTNNKDFTNTPTGREFAMMPVWKYVYSYGGKTYEYYVNGQTGKVYGKHPQSIGKILFTFFGSFLALSFLAYSILYFVEVF